jgi:hypothetical protein
VEVVGDFSEQKLAQVDKYSQVIECGQPKCVATRAFLWHPSLDPMSWSMS